MTTSAIGERSDHGGTKGLPINYVIKCKESRG